MKNFPYKKVLSRYRFLSFLLVLLVLVVLGKAFYIMFFQKDFWQTIAKRNEKVKIIIAPTRGNIYSADSQLMATSLPQYKIYIDYVVSDKDSAICARAQTERDSLFIKNCDSLAIGLNRILPDKSVNWFKNRLKEGKSAKSRYWLVYPYRISYMDYKEIKKLPFFREGTRKSGFRCEQFNETKKPFGSLASRTLGSMYPGKDSAMSGIELKYDSILRGKAGVCHRQKVLNKFLTIVDTLQENGADIMTTIDVKIQDFAEKALKAKMREESVNGIHGVVLLMEVATGDIKAIVNLSRCADGEYREIKNTAVSNLMEPGSVFKPMSFLVAFNDGKLGIEDKIDCQGGRVKIHGREMKDHNWNRASAYHVLSASQCLEYSSNVGVSLFIDRFYGAHPEKFVEGIRKLGVGEDLQLDIPGYAVPRIPYPLDKNGKLKDTWSKVTLPWMSIGYATQVPPISVLSFYNGVANNGRMMRPRLVKAAMRNGEVIREFPPQVIREQMASPKAIKMLQTCLERVVSRGLGGKAGSKNFSVSGKTGTAQVWTKNGKSSNFLVSFAGYFPSEKPLYSCMVCIVKQGLPASGGGQCGPVFKQVAEMVMEQASKPELKHAKDTLRTHLPLVKDGNIRYAENVLGALNCSFINNEDISNKVEPLWGKSVIEKGIVKIETVKVEDKVVPNLIGMGARDAVFLLERLGMKVKLIGRGEVSAQSLPYGHTIVKGETILLTLKLKSDKNKVTGDSENGTHKNDSVNIVKKDSTKFIKKV